MPLVQIRGVKGYLSLEQKQELIRRVTEAVLSVAPALTVIRSEGTLTAQWPAAVTGFDLEAYARALAANNTTTTGTTHRRAT